MNKKEKYIMEKFEVVQQITRSAGVDIESILHNHIVGDRKIRSGHLLRDGKVEYVPVSYAGTQFKLIKNGADRNSPLVKAKMN